MPRIIYQVAVAQIVVLTGFARLVVDELELRHVAVTDQLTGCLSRRGFLPAEDSEIGRRRRYGRSTVRILRLTRRPIRGASRST